jgi:tetratricopeptide (TPR) repeat protein
MLIALSIATFASGQGLSGAPVGDTARAGWNAIRDGRNEEAAAAFTAAIEASPRDPTLYLGAGLAAQLLGNTGKARDLLEQALKLAPGFTTASLLLGDLVYGDSDLQGAIAIYEDALKYAPNDKTLTARLARLRQEPSPENGFFQSRSAHFTVLFEGWPTTNWRGARSISLNRPTGESAPPFTPIPIASSPSCSIPKSSSATPRDRRHGRLRPTTAGSGSRCAARSIRRRASSSASSRTSSPTQ